MAQWEGYVRSINSLIDTLARKGDEAALFEVDSVLGDDSTRLKDAIAQSRGEMDGSSTNQLNNILAAVIDLRVHSLAAMISMATATETVEQQPRSVARNDRGSTRPSLVFTRKC